MERLKFTNEYGEEELVAVDEFKDIPNDELRLRNVANVALNHFNDHDEDTALSYILHNVPQDDYPNFRTVLVEEAKKRGMWNESMGDSDISVSVH